MQTRNVQQNVFVLAMLWLFLYGSFALLSPALLDDADSVHAEVAREMLLRHDWVTLYANGIRYLEKAPMLYWSMAASMRVFGVGTAQARLPLALFALLLFLLTERFARTAFHSLRTGLYAGGALLLSFRLFIFTRILIPDAIVCLWLVAALYCFWLTEEAGSASLSKGVPWEEVPVTQHAAEPKFSEGHGFSHVDAPSLETSLPSARQWRTEEREEKSEDALPARLKPCPSENGSLPKEGTYPARYLIEAKTPLLPCLGFGVACALNILTKGLIGLVFPVGTVLLYLLATRGMRGAARRITQLHPLFNLLAFLIISVPWHVLAGLANPTEGHPAGLTHPGPLLPAFWRGWRVGTPTLGNVHGWTWFYFINEHLLRYLNLRVPRDYDTVPLLLFWGLLLVWLMPWSAFLFHAVGAVRWRSLLRHMRREQAMDREGRLLLLLAIAALLPVVFFSFSTRQEYYVLPSLPFFAMLIARWLDREAAEAEAMAVPSRLVTAGQRIGTVLVIGGAVAALGCAFFLFHSKPPDSHIDLATLLQQNPGDYALSFGHFLDLNGPAMGMFRRPLTITGVALFAGTFLTWWERRNYRPHRSNLALAATTLAFLVAAHMGLTIFAPVLSSEPLARKIAPVLAPSNLIIINDEYEAGSTLGFYLRRNNIHIWHGHSANLWYGSFFTDAPPIFETDESMRLRWLGPERVFLWTDPAKLPTLPGKVYVLAEGGGKEIVSNKAGQYE